MAQYPQIRDVAGGRIHMIGIGGSSMSGLAKMLLEKGYTVTGSDRDNSYHAEDARKAGAKVSIGHRAENVHGADMVVFTAAIPRDNPERIEAERLGIPMIERGELLGQLMKGADPAIAVCGAHGKTTTTAMIAQILVQCGKDPSIHIGERLDALGGSTRVGKGGGFLAEACEFNRSFLHMNPTMAVVLNIDADHLDCYKDIDEIEEAFGQFLQIRAFAGCSQPCRSAVSPLVCPKTVTGIRLISKRTTKAMILSCSCTRIRKWGRFASAFRGRSTRKMLWQRWPPPMRLAVI